MVTVAIEELMLHMDGLVLHQDCKFILETQKYLGVNKLWSSFVGKIWKNEQLHVKECAVQTTQKQLLFFLCTM
jgi:hypothetical protein